MTSGAKRKRTLLNSGTLSPNPWDLAHSRQNVCLTLEALERRTGLRRDATRAPIQGPEWQGGALTATPNGTRRPRRTKAYCGRKMVLTKGSTLGSGKSTLAEALRFAVKGAAGVSKKHLDLLQANVGNN